MYIIKKATVDDAESIRVVIEQVWMQSPLSKQKKAELFRDLEHSHSISRIIEDIKSNQMEYMLVTNEIDIIAFAAFSWDQVNQTQLNIRQLYDLGIKQAGDYLVELLSMVEAVGIRSGAEIIRVSLNHGGKLSFFESMGFYPFSFPGISKQFTATGGLELVKYLTIPTD